MGIKEVFVLIGAFVIFMAAYRVAGKFIRKMNPRTVKTINWAGFVLAVASGIASYIFQDSKFMLIAVAGTIVYFLFYDYEKPQEKRVL